jgi:hypothetical protein
VGISVFLPLKNRDRATPAAASGAIAIDYLIQPVEQSVQLHDPQVQPHFASLVGSLEGRDQSLFGLSDDDQLINDRGAPGVRKLLHEILHTLELASDCPNRY